MKKTKTMASKLLFRAWCDSCCVGTIVEYKKDIFKTGIIESCVPVSSDSASEYLPRYWEPWQSNDILIGLS